MRKLVLRRLITSVPLLFVVSLITFVLEHLVPGNAAEAIAGPTATAAQMAAVRHQLGLNLPLWDQYYKWLDAVFHGSLGTSLFSGQSVLSILAPRIPVTLSLVIGVFVVCVVVGIAVGIGSAVLEGTLGKIIDALSLLGLALPAFWVALVFISLFAVDIKLVPATGYTDFSSSIGGWMLSLILPVAALSLGAITIVAKQTRDALKDALESPYIRSLRASGIRESSLVLKHALKNAAPPVITIVGLIMVTVLSSSVFIEQVFVLPGLGSLAVQATEAHDLPIIEGIALVFTLITIGFNLLVDISYGLVNPKIELS